ncbi:NUDIX hydrolase [Paenibacillus ginsengarvi]|nr:NUDIX domain-containing protein [Paenibacillus ginsengarvi]
MNKNEERFDIFDGAMNRIGTATRAETHAKGYWHQTFHCWIVTRGEHGQPQLLFQKRHPEKDTFPDKYDITCAGHLQAGETPEDGVRELEEELGLDVPFASLTRIGTIPIEMRYRDLIDKEFYHTFLYECDLPLEQYRLQPDEVVGIVRADAADAAKLFAGEAEAVWADGLETQQEGRLVSSGRLLKRCDFVPHGDAYYKQVLGAVMHYFSK